MPLIVHPATRPLVGTISVPGDKSISHRAAIFAAMAAGRSRLGNFAPGEDCRHTLAALARLGVAVNGGSDGGTVVLDSPGWAAWREPEEPLDCGNSGTTMRLLCGAVAGRRGFFILTGDASLRRRPMQRIVQPLRAMGAQVDGRKDGSLAPLAIRGAPLRGLVMRLNVASAQVKTCLLLAGLAAEGTTWVSEPYLSRDHTERLLPAFGVQLLRELEQGSAARVGVRGPIERLEPLDFVIPGDPSAAAFFAAAACLVPGSSLLLRDVCVNPTRTGLFAVIAEATGGTHTGAPDSGPEPCQDIEVRHPASPLAAVSIGPPEVPALIDELPVLAVLATQARGTTRVRGAGALRYKESDRLTACAAGLAKLGARIAVHDDGWDIEGPTTLKGGVVSSRGDHRLAMALAVAALVARGPVVIQNARAAAVSDPGFFDRLRGLGVRVEEGGRGA